MASENPLPRAYSAFVQTNHTWIKEKAYKLGIDVSDVTQQLYLTLHQRQALDLEVLDNPDLNTQIREMLELDLKAHKSLAISSRFLAIENGTSGRSSALTVSLENLTAVAAEETTFHDPDIFKNYVHTLPSYQNPMLRRVLDGVLQQKPCSQIAEQAGITHFRVNQIVNELSDKISARNPYDMDRDARTGDAHPVTLCYARIEDLNVPISARLSVDLHEIETLIISTGYMRPVVVNQDLAVIDGAEFVQACANIGIEHVPYIILPTPAEDEHYLSNLRNMVQKAWGKLDTTIDAPPYHDKLTPELLGDLDAGLISEKVARVLSLLSEKRQTRLHATLGRTGLALLTEADAIRLASIRIRPGRDVYFEEALQRIQEQLEADTPPAAIRGVSPKRHAALIRQLQQAQSLLAELQAKLEDKIPLQLLAG